MTTHNAASVAEQDSLRRRPSNADVKGGLTRRQMDMLSDPELLDKVKHVIRTQFDYEVLLKRKEILSIKEELAKGEELVKIIKALVTGEPPEGKIVPQGQLPGTITADPSNVVTSPTTDTQNPKPPINNTNNNTSSPALPASTPSTNNNQPAPIITYATREDGVVVKLVCPACRRSDFLNIQGFMNHCRYKHKIEFGGHIDCVRKCGVEVMETETDATHLALRNSLLPKSFDQPVLPVTRETDNNKASASPRIQTVVHPKRRVAKINVHEPKDAIDIGIDSTMTNGSPVVLPLVPVVEEEDGTMTEPTNKKKHPIEDPANFDNDNTEPSKRVNTGNERSRIEELAMLSQNLVLRPGDEGSRYYITRRIIIGNVSRYIPPEKRSLDRYQFKWMVYIHSPPTEPDISTYITHAMFFLHEDYQPNDVVDIIAPPFQLTRYGWGEFVVRIRLFFVNPEKNKPKDIAYSLKLDRLMSGKQVLGGEEWFDIELDRETVFQSPKTNPTASVPGKKGRKKSKGSQLQQIESAQDKAESLLPISNESKYCWYCGRCHFGTDQDSIHLAQQCQKLRGHGSMVPHDANLSGYEGACKNNSTSLDDSACIWVASCMSEVVGHKLPEVEQPGPAGDDNQPTAVKLMCAATKVFARRLLERTMGAYYEQMRGFDTTPSGSGAGVSGRDGMLVPVHVREAIRDVHGQANQFDFLQSLPLSQ